MSEYTSYWGLTRRYGVDEAKKAKVWEEATGNRIVVEFKLDAETVPAAHNVDHDGLGAGVSARFGWVKIPGGMKVVGKEIITRTSWTDADGAPTLSADLVPVDELDATTNARAVLNAALEAELAAGVVHSGDASPFDVNPLNPQLEAGKAYTLRITVATATYDGVGDSTLRLTFAVPEKTVDTLGNPQPN